MGFNARFIVGLSILLIGCSSGSEKRENRDSASQTRVSKPQNSSSKIVEIENLNLKIEIPLQLSPMSEELFRVKYPYENWETSTAYSNSNGTVSLLISPKPDIASQADLPRFRSMLNQSLGKNAAINILKNQIEVINNRKFIVLDMISAAVDTRIYNKMFVTDSNGHLLMCSFNCTIDKRKEWEPVADEILKSVKIAD